MPNMMGKRYTCGECGMEILVSKTGEGLVQCHQEMKQVAPPSYVTSPNATIAII